MTSLQHLDLSSNRLTGLGRGEDARRILGLLARFDHLFLHGNPWECPPASVVVYGIDWMKKYYDELERADPVMIDTRKVVFIGESGAGKTSLIKSIMAGRGQLTLEEDRETVGVSVQGHVLDGENQDKGTDVKFYDLAGQVDYYGLHQLFLTETALYVLVWDASKYRHQTKVLMEYLDEWLKTLHLRAPNSTVLLCASHKDKCEPRNFMAKLKRYRPYEEEITDIETSIRDKHGQRTISPRSLKLESGIELVSSSPSVRLSESGLSHLIERIQECGKGTKCLIPPSWRLALEVLDALRDGREPLEACRRFWKKENRPQAVSTEKRNWITNEDLWGRWKGVVENFAMAPMEFTPADPKFVLDSVIALRESGGSLLRHPEGVFLDVEDFALSLAPILNHKIQQKDRDGTAMFAGRRLDADWMLNAKRQLVEKGVLNTRFARHLWNKEKLPRQTFDVLVKLGILLPLPQKQNPDTPRHGPSDEDFLVFMRLPPIPAIETMARFAKFKLLESKWGIAAKWQFELGSAPYGLVERLIASCHAIGIVERGTYWRRGACFIANPESVEAAGGSFALALHFDPSSEHLNVAKAGTLVVQVFGRRDGRAIWGALRFVISSAWRLFKEFPGLGWEAWLDCPEHAGYRLFLARGCDSMGKSPGDPLVRREACNGCEISRDMARRLGKVLWPSSSRDPYTLEAVFETTDGVYRGFGVSDENEFRRDLDDVVVATRKSSAEEEREGRDEEGNMPEWLKDAVIAGPAGALALYETWTPLFKLVDYWREGALEEAIPLTVFAILLLTAVVSLAGVAFRKLRFKYGWWPPRRHMKVE